MSGRMTLWFEVEILAGFRSSMPRLNNVLRQSAGADQVRFGFRTHSLSARKAGVVLISGRRRPESSQLSKFVLPRLRCKDRSIFGANRVVFSHVPRDAGRASQAAPSAPERQALAGGPGVKTD
jgi:hypothetical protein